MKRSRGIVLNLVAAFLTAALSMAAEYTVYPTLETNTTGYSDHASKNDGEVLAYGGASTGTVRMETGYFKFDTSVIPDTSTVDGIWFHFHVNDTNWPYWSVTPVDLDPVPIGSTAALLWDDAQAEKTSGYYNYQNESSAFAPGWKTLALGGTATADMTAGLADDWFALAAVSRDTTTTYYLEIDGHDGLFVPYLVVDDEPPPPPPGCWSATVIPGTPGQYTFTGDTTASTDWLDCSAPCVGGLPHPGPNVAYSVTLPGGCEICVTLNQSVMTWNGGVYMVTDCADVDGTCVAGASGWLPASVDETFCFSATGTETYYIIVDGRSSYDAGPFQLDVDVTCLQGPTDLTCSGAYYAVDLAWTNNDAYDAVEVHVNGLLHATLPGNAESFTAYPEPGHVCFRVRGVAGADSGCSGDCCLIVGYNLQWIVWDFESDDGGFDVQGTAAWEWGAPAHGPCSATAEGNVWGTDLDADYLNDACWLLDSSPVTIGNAFLAVDHCYDTEDGWDGGVVWFTTDDYWYYSVEPLDGTDGVISDDVGCPWVGNHAGFTGDSGGWVTDIWDFTDGMWEFDDVKILFAFGSDGSVSTYPGWMIDSITLYERDHHHPMECDYTITPLSGTVPFQTVHRVTLGNFLTGGTAWTRRHAARIAVTIGNGTHYNPWRAGYTNVAPGTMFSTQFSVNMPALGSVIGTNTFTLIAQDVTPAPYNQPPYPPAGSTCTWTNVVTANAP